MEEKTVSATRGKALERMKGCAEGGALARDEKDINYKRHPPSDGNLLEVIQNEAPFDMFIHLGDAEGSGGHDYVVV